MMYCVKCKKFTSTKQQKVRVTENGKRALWGICEICNSTKTSFLKKLKE